MEERDEAYDKVIRPATKVQDIMNDINEDGVRIKLFEHRSALVTTPTKTLRQVPGLSLTKSDVGMASLQEDDEGDEEQPEYTQQLASYGRLISAKGDSAKFRNPVEEEEGPSTKTSGKSSIPCRAASIVLNALQTLV